MSAPKKATMRDAIISRITEKMALDERIVFLSADLGAPALDGLRQRYPDRFVNVGIAEQNLVAVASGIALEGGIPFAFGLAPFLSMRALEQIRNNLALFGRLRALNVNLLALGAGLSYDVSGPTHHCVEDISIIRTLPGIDLYSPSDPETAAAIAEHVLGIPRPAYLRLEGKPVPDLAKRVDGEDLSRGFRELQTGDTLCIVATGYPVHTCLEVVRRLGDAGHAVGLVDLFAFRPCDESLLFETLSRYARLFSVEEGVVGRGGLDAFLMALFNDRSQSIRLTPFGLDDGYLFENGDRRGLHRTAGMDGETLFESAREVLVFEARV